MFPAFLLGSEIAGAALPLLYDLLQRHKKKVDPETGQEAEDPDAPGFGRLALDAASGLTGLGLVRGGLGAALGVAKAAGAAGHGPIRQTAAGFGSLWKSAIGGAPAEVKAASGVADAGVAGAAAAAQTDQALASHFGMTRPPQTPPNAAGMRESIVPTDRFQMVDGQQKLLGYTPRQTPPNAGGTTDYVGPPTDQFTMATPTSAARLPMVLPRTGQDPATLREMIMLDMLRAKRMSNAAAYG